MALALGDSSFELDRVPDFVSLGEDESWLGVGVLALEVSIDGSEYVRGVSVSGDEASAEDSGEAVSDTVVEAVSDVVVEAVSESDREKFSQPDAVGDMVISGVGSCDGASSEGGAETEDVADEEGESDAIGDVVSSGVGSCDTGSSEGRGSEGGAETEAGTETEAGADEENIVLVTEGGAEFEKLTV